VGMKLAHLPAQRCFVADDHMVPTLATNRANDPSLCARCCGTPGARNTPARFVSWRSKGYVGISVSSTREQNPPHSGSCSDSTCAILDQNAPHNRNKHEKYEKYDW